VTAAQTPTNPAALSVPFRRHSWIASNSTTGAVTYFTMTDRAAQAAPRKSSRRCSIQIASSSQNSTTASLCASPTVCVRTSGFQR
jgi:hypothetical protein